EEKLESTYSFVQLYGFGPKNNNKIAGIRMNNPPHPILKISKIIAHKSILGNLKFPKSNTSFNRKSQSFAAHLSENLGLTTKNPSRITIIPPIRYHIAVDKKYAPIPKYQLPIEYPTISIIPHII
ncbi:MAG: hypothetical protein P8Y70_16925, partial [Candidatus Lokiarchaeota archaeon]